MAEPDHPTTMRAAAPGVVPATAALWSGVLEGFVTPSAVVDADGRMLASNQSNAQLNPTSGTSETHAHLADFLPRNFVDQTLRIARRVLATAQPAVTVNMWKGYWWRCRFWRVRPPGVPAPACAITCDPWKPAIMGEPGAAEPPAEELEHHDLGDLATLSTREAEVLWFLGQGRSVPDIASELSRSVKTIETHVRALSIKLALSGRVALVTLARERGITSMTLDQVTRVFSKS